MTAHNQDKEAMKPFFVDMELHATEQYLRAGRYFENETYESLVLEWQAAIFRMREGHLGHGLLSAIVGVLGELGLRGLSLPEGWMAEMNRAAADAFAPLDQDIKRKLLNDLADRVAESMVDAHKLH